MDTREKGRLVLLIGAYANAVEFRATVAETHPSEVDSARDAEHQVRDELLDFVTEEL